MRRIGVVCTLLVFITLVMPSSVLSLGSDMEINEVVNNNDSSLSLMIEEVSMSDHNVMCSMLGGQNVSICVRVRNQGDEDFNGTFSVKIFTDQISYLEQQNITEPIGSGYSKRVHFLNIHISEEIGEHTLDAFINDDISTRNYCEFKSTLIGIDTLNVVESSPESNNQGKVSIAQIYLKSDKTITVDDDGGADFTTIQDAIDNATDGDTIFVYGGIYHENVVIDKSIELVAEDRNETTVHASGIGDIIFVSSSNVSINGFTLTHSGYDNNDAGIEIDLYSSNNTISNNMFIYCTQGIYMHHSSNNIIEDNAFNNIDSDAIAMFSHCDNNIVSGNIMGPNVVDGIVLFKSTGNTFSRNTIEHINDEGISLVNSDNNLISDNFISSSWHTGLGIEGSSNVIIGNILFSNFDFGIYINDCRSESNNNTISGNTIKLNHVGVYLGDNLENSITSNNFLHNSRDVFFINTNNEFDSNYWERPRILPKILFGYEDLNDKTPNTIALDWHPAREPYDIN